MVAPLFLIATVVASFAATLGLATLLFTRVLDDAALDTSLPLLAFLFLVALGVDYNIFLATRAREESATSDARRGCCARSRPPAGWSPARGDPREPLRR